LDVSSARPLRTHHFGSALFKQLDGASGLHPHDALHDAVREKPANPVENSLAHVRTHHFGSALFKQSDGASGLHPHDALHDAVREKPANPVENSLAHVYLLSGLSEPHYSPNVAPGLLKMNTGPETPVPQTPRGFIFHLLLV
jgi:hypothetical protein